MRLPVLFLLSFLFLSLLVGFNLYSSFQSHGQLVYPLDDAYIHMAISKNLMEHGVWGVTRFEFSSTSSSILYTLLLSVSFLILGVKAWIPLAINWLVAGGIVYLTSRISLRFMKGRAALLLNFAFILLVPIPGMVMLGMEHTLQILFCILFLWLSYRKWEGAPVSNLLYGAIALLAVLTRYESAFLVGLAAGIWLLLYRKPATFLLLLACIALPVCGFGLYAISKGGLFFPNSLLAKSNFASGSVGGYIADLGQKIIYNSLVFSLVFLPLVYWLLFPVDR
ncbi:MAG TPA: hypothetical protein VM187_04165, partial [Niastella sp.]|nr:hypothetical protein [Niastella sp.]